MRSSLYSRWCVLLTLAYVAAAIFVIWDDRTHTGAGNWISLRGMTSFLATFPISAFFDAFLSIRLDYRSNLEMGFAILGTAVCVYFACFGAATLLHTIFFSHRQPPEPPK